MRFESVRAHPFGPFHDETLSLAPGLNVVYGPNEAGKSTWHAALYAGLCGMRRGKGAASTQDRRFRDRHRPWDARGGWAVSAVVALADNRRVELRQDLANRVNCSASDADLAGRDYASEIVYDGAPDGSRWLGLNRKSFLGAACVRQAQILGLLNDPDVLQEDLQRAAATAGTDETAARALELLTTYRRERVGTAQARTKPLRTSEARLNTARLSLEAARRAHAEYLHRCRDVERLGRAARCASRTGGFERGAPCLSRGGALRAVSRRSPDSRRRGIRAAVRGQRGDAGDPVHSRGGRAGVGAAADIGSPGRPDGPAFLPLTGSPERSVSQRRQQAGTDVQWRRYRLGRDRDQGEKRCARP